MEAGRVVSSVVGLAVSGRVLICMGSVSLMKMVMGNGVD